MKCSSAILGRLSSLFELRMRKVRLDNSNWTLFNLTSPLAQFLLLLGMKNKVPICPFLQLDRRESPQSRKIVGRRRGDISNGERNIPSIYYMSPWTNWLAELYCEWMIANHKNRIELSTCDKFDDNYRNHMIIISIWRANWNREMPIYAFELVHSISLLSAALWAPSPFGACAICASNVIVLCGHQQPNDDNQSARTWLNDCWHSGVQEITCWGRGSWLDDDKRAATR